MKNCFLLFLVCLITVTVHGGSINEKQAYAIARQFATSHGFAYKSDKAHISESRKSKSAKPSPADVCYVVNVNDDGGFVIVSGDDRLGPVLGYSKTGGYDPDNKPTGLEWMLDTYASVIESLGGAARQKASASRPAIPYLIQTQWNQAKPYNLLCPQESDGTYTYTGCVATAMAQVLNYWQCPSGSTGVIPAYSSYDALPSTTFDWAKMQQSYSYDADDDSALEVAKLMEYCGHAVEMSYSTSGSSAHLSPSSLSKYFGFSPEAAELSRSGISTAQWEDIIYGELSAGRPVFYSGFPMSGSGHEFICDGYDGDGYYHINWGWGGSSDGYFSLSALMPSGGVEGDNYNSNQSIVYNVKPLQNGESSEYTGLSVIGDISLDGNTTVTRGSAGEGFSGLPKTSLNFINSGSESQSFEYGMALYKGEQNLGIIDKQAISGLGKNYTFYDSFDLNIDMLSNLTDGEYRIVPVSRSTDGGDTQLTPCLLSDIKYIKVIVDGNTMTLQVMPYAGGKAFFNISQFSIDGRLKQGRSVVAKFRLSNTGTGGSEVPLYISVGGSSAGGLTTYCDPGDAIDVSIPFTLNGVGSASITIATGDTMLYSGTINIETATVASLKGDVSMNAPRRGADNFVTASFVIKATNIISLDYDDDIKVVVYKYVDSKFKLDSTLYIGAKIPANSTADIPFSLENVDASCYGYLIDAYYYNKSREENLAYDYFNPNRAYLVAPLQNLGNLQHAPEKITATVTNNGAEDYDGDIVFELRHQSGDYYYSRQRDTIKAALPVGSSLTMTIRPDLFQNADTGNYVATITYTDAKTEIADRTLRIDLAKFTIVPGDKQEITATVLSNATLKGKDIDVKFVNEGNNDYDNAVRVSLQLYKNGLYCGTVYSDTQVVNIPARDSVVVKYSLPDLSDGGSYYGDFYYITENNAEYCGYFNMQKAEMSDFDISDVGMTEIVGVGRSCNVHLTITNKTSTNKYFPVTLTLNDSIVYAQNIYIHGGSTERCELMFTPTAVGKCNLVLYNGDAWFADVLYDKSANVRDSAEASIQGLFILKSQTTDSDDSFCADLSLELTNYLDTDFDDAIYLKHEGYQESNYYNYIIKDTAIHVRIPANQSISVPLNISHMSNEFTYHCISARYYNLTEEKYCDGVYIYPSMPVLSVTAQAGKRDSTSTAPKSLELTVTNNGLADYNGEAYITISKKNGEQYETCQNGSQELSVVAGGETTFTYMIDNYDAYEDGDYYVLLEYKAVSDSWRYYQTSPVEAFKVSTESGIKAVKVGNTDHLKVYDISGRYLGTMAAKDFNSKLKRGIYIVNGKKMVIR